MPENANIQNAVQMFFEAVDAGDWTQAESLMRAPFHLDYSSYGAGPAADLAPSDILTEWQGVLPGFDATHHQLGPLVIDVDGDSAEVRAYVTATHSLKGAEGGPLWTVVGSYEVSLLRNGGQWRLSGLTFHFKFQDGNTHLPGLAQARLAS